jgi:antitoxin MazE
LHHLALRIPKSFASEIHVKENSLVQLSFIDGKLVVTVVQEPEYTLDDLLAQVTDANIHHEVETGVTVGEEAW